MTRYRGAVLAALLLLAGCTAQTTPTNLAKYGWFVMDAVKVAEETIITLNAQHAVDDEKTAQAMILFDQIGRRGRDLSQALSAYQHGTGAAKAFAEGNIRAGLAAIRDLLRALPQVGSYDYTKSLRAIADALGTVETVLEQTGKGGPS